MYVPKSFAVEDRQTLLRFIGSEPFGILVSNSDGKPSATHVPFVVLQNDPTVLGVHVAKANPQWNSIDGQEVLAIFHGSHALISASWYTNPQKDVPTWDYSAVHCSGIASITSLEATREIVEQTAARLDPQWKMADADAEYIARLQQAIVGIRIDVTSIIGSFKYSQNRTLDDRNRVLERLRESSRAMDRDLAQRMTEIS